MEKNINGPNEFDIGIRTCYGKSVSAKKLSNRPHIRCEQRVLNFFYFVIMSTYITVGSILVSIIMFLIILIPNVFVKNE